MHIGIPLFLPIALTSLIWLILLAPTFMMKYNTSGPASGLKAVMVCIAFTKQRLSFTLKMEEGGCKLILYSPSKFCNLDPCPTTLVKICIDILANTLPITNNTSNTEGTFVQIVSCLPSTLKALCTQKPPHKLLPSF